MRQWSGSAGGNRQQDDLTAVVVKRQSVSAKAWTLNALRNDSQEDIKFAWATRAVVPAGLAVSRWLSAATTVGRDTTGTSDADVHHKSLPNDVHHPAGVHSRISRWLSGDSGRHDTTGTGYSIIASGTLEGCQNPETAPTAINQGIIGVIGDPGFLQHLHQFLVEGFHAMMFLLSG